MKSKKLEDNLKTIKRYFNVKKVISSNINTRSIANYYRVNKLAYSFFHRGNDFIHMGLSRDGKFKKEDLLVHSQIVGKYINSAKKENILELATGRGASSEYLAKKFPQSVFYGIDLPNGQLDYAFKKAKYLKNFYPAEGDYHNLTIYQNNFFDVVFVFEALCHSTNKYKVLQEVFRVLKKGGVLIIIDGYAAKPLSKLTSNELLAKQLAEKGMMVENFEFYNNVRNYIKRAKFKIIYEEDASLQIVPSLKRFENIASKLFLFPSFLAKPMVKLLPPEFINNALSGYLLYTLIELGVVKYEIIVCKK